MSNTSRLEPSAPPVSEPHRTSQLHSCLTNVSMSMSIGRLVIITTVTGSQLQTTAVNRHFWIRIGFLAMSSCWTLLWYCTRRNNRQTDIWNGLFYNYVSTHTCCSAQMLRCVKLCMCTAYRNMEHMFWCGQEMTWYIQQNNDLYFTSKICTHTCTRAAHTHTHTHNITV
jgi:hypothetical protein